MGNQQILDEAQQSRLLLEEIARELAVIKQEYFEQISRQDEFQENKNTKSADDQINDMFNVKKKEENEQTKQADTKPQVYQSLSGEVNDFASESDESSSYLSDTEKNIESSESDDFMDKPEPKKVIVERSIDDVLYTPKPVEPPQEKQENSVKQRHDSNSTVTDNLQRQSSQSSILSWLKIDKKPTSADNNNNDFDWITSTEPNQLPPLPKEEKSEKAKTLSSPSSKPNKYRIKSGDFVRSSPAPVASNT